MNDLERYFQSSKGRRLFKWSHYFDVYERHFSRFRNKDINFLEVGILNGGSLEMWDHYFAGRARIFAIDADARCKKFESDSVTVFTGSPTDREFLRAVRSRIPKVDILVDDGRHEMEEQIVTFEELFRHVISDGVYLIEDLQTSYWEEFGGGYLRPGTFMEYSKLLIDQLNAFHSRENGHKVTAFTESVVGMHYYDSVLVVEKGRRGMPNLVRTGRKSL